MFLCIITTREMRCLPKDGAAAQLSLALLLEHPVREQEPKLSCSNLDSFSEAASSAALLRSRRYS